MPSDPKKPQPAWPGAVEFQKMLSQMQVPGMPNAEALMRAHQRNLDALSAANRIAMEGAQAVAQRNMEIMQQTMAELTSTLQALASNPTPQDTAAKQTALLKAAYERAVANSREVGDLIQRANGEAMGALNTRMAEAIEELTQLTNTTRKG